MHASRRARTPDGGLPLSGKSNTTPPTRKERRAADRRDRYDTARDERRARAASTSDRGGSSLINTRTMTIVGVLVGVLIVAVVAFNQLGGRAAGELAAPEVEFPVAIQDGPSLGSVGAPVTLEVYEDYQCPVCARYALDVEPEIVDRYVLTNKVRIVHHDISILGRGDVASTSNESTLPAMGASCADEQDLFWSFAHWTYANQQGENRGAFNREGVTRIAVAAGVEEAAFGTCMDRPDTVASVVTTTQEAAALAIQSTPTFRINGSDPIRGLLSVEQLSGLLDQALAEASPAP
jgi:protein-disulfide isomerase